MTKEMQGLEQATKNVEESEKLLLRVSLLGEFRLNWQVTPATEEALWNSRTSARALFKLLLCAPGRQASRSQLAGLLWPESDEDKARESLRQARNVLRKMLRAADGTELLEQRSGTGETLKLADQAHLWVDADAFEEYAAQASRAASADEALPLFQQAQALLIGEFLAEDQSAEWARHRWVKQRRQVLLLARGRMVRHLADLYLTHGQISLAEEVLERHLTRFPTDQDALYRLLVLLEQQACFEEARLLYERSRRTLEALGKQLAPHVRALYARFQQTITSEGIQPPAPGSSLLLSGLAQSRPKDAVRGMVHAARGETLWHEQGGEASDAAWKVLRILLDSEPEGRSAMALLSRRQLLELGIAALIGRLARLDMTHVSAVDREELGLVLSKSVADGWKLFLTTSNAQVLAVSQLQLALIHQAHTLLYPATRSYLYAGTYGLIGLGLHLQERYEAALQSYHHAHLAAGATGDPWYVAQSLICQADTYMAMRMHAEAQRLIEEALSGLGESDAQHRRARAHLLGCWADVAMTTGDYTTAQQKLDESAQYLDQVALAEEFDRTCWLQLAGKRALMAGEYQRAIAALEEASAASPPDWLVRQAGILTPLAMAYARMREREQSFSIAQQAIAAISAVNAPMANTHFLEYIKGDVLGRFPADRRTRAFLTEAQQQLPQLLAFVDA